MNKNNKNIILNSKKKSGFTLIELMVATSIFVIVMLASMSSLFVLLDAARNSRALRFAMDNVNFAMESMTRSIRMGTNYYCGQPGDNMPASNDFDSTKDCEDQGGTLVAFVSQPQGSNPGARIGYRLSVADENGRHSIERCDSSVCVPIISSGVDINRLKFFVNDSGDNDGQASVYIIVQGTVMVKDVPTSFAIQTMASQRNF